LSNPAHTSLADEVAESSIHRYDGSILLVLVVHSGHNWQQERVL
jgi:hypothetical protein